MSSNARARLARLESSFRPLRGCDDCLDQAGTVRLCSVDERGTVQWASRPEVCPTCGLGLAPDPPSAREIRLTGIDLSKL